jgi:PAS domain S-box-containing protein
MGISSWFDSTDLMSAVPPHATIWPWVTIALSSAMISGYGVIAFNWYFQEKLARHADARAALARLRNICLASLVCSYVFFATDMPWLIWRVYDLTLLGLACYTWSYALGMRGMALVDERLAQMQELEQSARRYREIAELLPHMVWTADSAGNVDFSNARWRDYAGDNRTWLDAIHPDDRDAATARWTEATSARVPMSFEVRLGGVRGHRTFVVKATPIVHGDAVKWLGACADIEDQKLLAAEKEMQAKQKSFFLNALSHDLRAPLHNVLLNAHLLKLSVTGSDDVESVNMIVENTVAAGDLVTKLLDFAKVGAEDTNVIEPVSVAATLQQIVRRFQPIAEQKGLYLRCTDADAGVMTDRQKIERIISNLVDNAIKYTPRGGVSIGLSAVNDEVAVCICDTGIGIPAEKIPYLFDEFYQVDNHERDRSKGFGMGLAICRCLARHIGGDVRLAHTGPGGSCFEVVVDRAGGNRGRGRGRGGGGGGGGGGAIASADVAGASASGRAGCDVGADRGGRPDRTNRDLPSPAPVRLCGV